MRGRERSVERRSEWRKRVMRGMGKPYDTRGAHGPEYLLRKFLDHPDIGISTDTARFAKSMKQKGVKKGLKFKKGFGSGGKAGKQRLCTASALEEVFKKIRRA